MNTPLPLNSECYNRGDNTQLARSSGPRCGHAQAVLTFDVSPSLTIRCPGISGHTEAMGPAQFPGVLKDVMKRFTRVLAMLLIVAALPALASNDKAAKALYDKGKAAEARQDYIEAY